MIKIHLIRSPEYEVENQRAVLELLNSFPGPIEFEMNEHEFNADDYYFLQYRLYPHHNFRIDENKKKNFETFLGTPLSWEELFHLCHEYRRMFRIKRNDYVMLLTYRMNSLNWFSHIDENKNAFIQTAEWEKYYINVHHKYPVAYQVIKNLFQNLLELDTTTSFGDNIHFHPLGCINDFCADKRQVILKLRTADICEKCHRRALSKNVPLNVINQIYQILEGLRSQFLFRKDIQRNMGKIYEVRVDEKYRIYIPQLGNQEIKLNPLFKTLYLLYLKYSDDGIPLNQLSQYKEELKKLYSLLNPNLDPERIEKSIKDLIDPVYGTFSQKKSKINKEIQKQLGSDSNNFQITGSRGQPFKINLSSDNINLRF